MKAQSPLVFRLEPELHERLKECAARTRIKKYSLALLAIEAAVEAIEKNDYQLVVPIKFDVTHVAVPKRYPGHEAQFTRVEDKATSSALQAVEQEAIQAIRRRFPKAGVPPPKSGSQP